MKKLFLIFIFLSNYFLLFAQIQTIYIAKSYWHTGLIIEINELSLEALPVLIKFADREFVDIGMGERDFYMSPSRDVVPAAKAILIPTEAAIRIAEVPGDTAFLRRTSDYLISIEIDSTSFRNLLNYVNESISKNDEGEYSVIEERAGGTIVFYNSPQSYHLFNTCNTWLARALQKGGIDIKPSDVITSKDLFYRLLDKALILKYDTTDTIF
ncbi:hypothetical protein ASZ90_003609 [hydrocarbon metagenome]|uniref:DUF2459 domain-containing protein n=1 Tax=hydrocarbon metagenome TaxID=938273 RepID=A0A0W8G0E2_9ZZZZ